MSADASIADTVAKEEPHELWGISVPIDNFGRRRWPNKIKEMAVQRVAAGSTIAELAREMDLSGCTLGKWVRKKRSDKISPPQFVEVGVHNTAQLDEVGNGVTRSNDFHAENSGRAQTPNDECVLHFGNCELKFNARIAPSNLVSVIKAITSASG